MWQKIEVLLAEITRGKPGYPDRCPVALAMRRVFQKKPGQVRVVGDYALVDHLNDSVEINLPKSEVLRIMDFDRHRGMQPHTFSVQVPKRLLPVTGRK